MHKRLSRKESTYLARARHCRVGSVDRKGVPHTAPLCHAFDPARRVLYVATDGVTASNLRARHRAAIECDDYFEDWDRLRGFVAYARSRVVDRGAELER